MPRAFNCGSAEHLRKGLDRSEADIEFQQPFDPVRERLAAKHRVEIGDHRRLMRAGPLQTEIDEVWPFHGIEQVADEFLFLSRQGQIAVIRGAVDPIERAPPVVRSCLAICCRPSDIAGPSTLTQAETMESYIEMSM